MATSYNLFSANNSSIKVDLSDDANMLSFTTPGGLVITLEKSELESFSPSLETESPAVWDFTIGPKSFGDANSQYILAWESLSCRNRDNDGFILEILGGKASSQLLISDPDNTIASEVVIEGDCTFSFDAAGAFQAGESSVSIYRPDAQNQVVLSLDQFKFTGGSIGFSWQDPNINYWLKQLMGGFYDKGSNELVDADLAIHFSGDEINQIQLDWQVVTANQTGGHRTFQLPGLEIDIHDRFRQSVVLGAGTHRLNRLSFYSTSTFAISYEARSHFAWNQGDDRELLIDESRNSASFPVVSLRLTSDANTTSYALMEFDRAKGTLPVFFQKADVEVPAIDFTTLSEVSVSHIQIEKERFVDELSDPNSMGLDLKIGAEPNEESFKFPFLRLSDDILGEQFLELSGDPEFKSVSGNLISIKVHANIHIGNLLLPLSMHLDFDWQLVGFRVNHNLGIELVSAQSEINFSSEYMGLIWRFFGKNQGTEFLFFNLLTKNYHYQIKQAQDASVEFDFTKASEEPITFKSDNFLLLPTGVTLIAAVTDKPARLNGLETRYRFEDSRFQIIENRIADFTIMGSGPLPPDLLGDAIANIGLQFHQQNNGNLTLVAGGAELDKIDLLSCLSTRFEYAVDAIELKFVETIDQVGGESVSKFHLYYTLSGTAQYVPFASDDSNHPLALLNVALIEMVDVPITGNARVIRNYVDFLVPLPTPVSFDFLGCFAMEIKSFGFLPQAFPFDDDPGMILGGQLFFSVTGDDTKSAKVDFHGLYLGVPRKDGKFTPRLHFENLSVEIKYGEAFELSASVSMLDTPTESGFSGEGVLQIKGLPTFAASFAFLRVRNQESEPWKRAWFIYLEGRKITYLIPYVSIYLREIGLGFGYRYTLTSIKEADKDQSVGKLLGALRELSKTAGDLSKRDRWAIDLENPGEDPRWTIVMRAMFSQSASPSSTPLKYHEQGEKTVPCPYIFDAVIAFRSDLTFFMAVRGWLNTNYNDYITGGDDLRENPLFSGFILLSSRKKRLLAQLASNPDGKLGTRPKLPPMLEKAVQKASFSATLLMEPGLVHFELGWPNMMRWTEYYGPLEVEFRGGFIFRVTEEIMLIGVSFGARAKMDIEEGFNAAVVGAELTAKLNAEIGARFMALTSLKSASDYALYGAIGLDVRLDVKIVIWVGVKVGFVKITKEFDFSLNLGLTGSMEMGLVGTSPGVRGKGTISVRLKGHSLKFGVGFGFRESEVSAALNKVRPYLNTGLEAMDADGLNPAPRAKDISRTTLEETLALVEVIDIEDPFIVSITNPPHSSTGVAKVDKNVIEFTPADDFFGTVSIGYKIRDDKGRSDTGVLTIVVTPVNDPPVVYDLERSTPEAQAITVQVLASDRDVDGDLLTIINPVLTPSDAGELIVNGKNITFTPILGHLGTVSIDYTVTDGKGGEDSATLTIIVFDQNFSPVAQDEIVTIGKNSESVEVLLQATDADNDHLTYSIVGGPKAEEGVAEIILKNSDDVYLVFTPALDYSGKVLITYEVDDGNLGIDTGLVTIDVKEPLAVDVSAVTGQDEPVTVSVINKEAQVNASQVTITIETNPVSGTAIVSNGNIIYTPSPGHSGTDSIVFSISDGQSKNTATLSLQVVLPIANPAYNIFLIHKPVKEASQSDKEYTYFMFLPKGEDERGFLPVPPDASVSITEDFKLTLPEGDQGLILERFDPVGNSWVSNSADQPISWKVDWDAVIQPDIEEYSDEGELTNSSTSFSLRDYLTYAFITQETADGDVPVGDPDPIASSEMTLADERVQNPTDDAFEAAVRGAVEQFRGSPLFKRDPNHAYDQILEQAFDENTSLYSEDGLISDDATDEIRKMNEQVDQVRGMIIHDLISDFRNYVDEKRNGKLDSEITIDNSIPFKMGLVFRVEGKGDDLPGWLNQVSINESEGPKLSQRINTTSSTVTANDKPVTTFNVPATDFSKYPPQFQGVKQYTSANTIALAWNLLWETPPTGVTGTQADPEEHLIHYQVRRRTLDGSDPEVFFTVKNAETLNFDAENGVLQRLKPRFQIVDNFNYETLEDQAGLPVEGRDYLYTITPCDTAGNLGRPLTIVATRFPNEPPLVPADAELTVKYKIAKDQLEPLADTLVPNVIKPTEINLIWEEPIPSPGSPEVPIDSYCLVFRKEKTLPIGSYNLDGETQGPSGKALPTSNARSLPTDIKVEIKPDGSGRKRFATLGIDNQEEMDIIDILNDKDILPHGEKWRPEAWTVFIQTISINKVPSALAPVRLRLEVTSEEVSDTPEDKRPAQIEWLPEAILLPLLPPVDQKAIHGPAHFPMPSLDENGEPQLFAGSLRPVKFQEHPKGIQCIRFRWNQGPSQQPQYPIDLNAGFELLELNVDAHTTDTFTAPEKLAKAINKIQEVQLLPGDELLFAPGTTHNTSQWEAWYPSTLLRQRDKKDLLPGAENTLKAWFSWRDSYLVWPDWPGVSDGAAERTEMIHPDLQRIVDLLSGEEVHPDIPFTYHVELESSPPIQPGNFTTFLANTAAETDPYGWTVLQTLGLSITFSLRYKSQNLEVVTGQDLLEVVDSAVSLLGAEIKPHLFIETLFQPGRKDTSGRGRSR